MVAFRITQHEGESTFLIVAVGKTGRCIEALG